LAEESHQLRDELSQFKKMIFGAKSEKSKNVPPPPANQLNMFAELKEVEIIPETTEVKGKIL
jgi:hypothetical protein